jgi:Uma2 family endonuclease
LIIEVLSPDYRQVDHQEKWREYEAIGVREYWIVDVGIGRVSILCMVQGHYQETIFNLGQKLISPTFIDMQLTVDEILNADL